MITFTEKAKEKIFFYLGDKKRDEWGVRIRVKGPGKYDFALEELKVVPTTDKVLNEGDVKLVLDKTSEIQLLDAKVDFVETPFSSGFKVEVSHSIPVAPGGPDLSDPLAKKVQEVLTKEINPALAGHGGMARLIAVKDKVVYLKLGGGCQGCGVADVTLKQGIETRLKEAIPEIVGVVDQTDHASGTNPYFHP